MSAGFEAGREGFASRLLLLMLVALQHQPVEDPLARPTTESVFGAVSKLVSRTPCTEIRGIIGGRAISPSFHKTLPAKQRDVP